jgi:hypothetical protein
MSAHRIALAAALLTLVPLGCGGSTSGGGAAGTAGTGGGAAGAGGGGGGHAGTGGATGCPASLPPPFTQCAPEGATCTYGSCCAITAQCLQGQRLGVLMLVWHVLPSACPQPACFPEPPSNGEPCECHAGLNCLYGDNCQEGITSASCDGKAWTVVTEGCASPDAGVCPGGALIQGCSGPASGDQCSGDPAHPNFYYCTPSAPLPKDCCVYQHSGSTGDAYCCA